MSRNPIYHKVMGSQRWVRLRREYLTHHPLCERCEKEGRTTLAHEVHHITPVETAPDEEGMKRLAYDMGNLMALCSDCHHIIHDEMGSTHSWSKEKNRARAAKAVDDLKKNWL